jgi:hypothetical protein
MYSLDPKRVIPAFLVLAGLLHAAVFAQEEVAPFLSGEVRVGQDLLPGAMVVLHWVSADESGQIDSIRSAQDGSFRLPLPYVPDHASRPEVFFASVEYGGLLYFGPAVTEAVQLDSLYLIQAFDTVSVSPGGAELPVSARNLFLEQAPGGWTATDVFEIRNDGDRTLYSPQEGVVWSYPLPPSATDFQLGQGDMAPDAVRFEEGQVRVYAPVPPGERQILVRYRIQEREFSLPLPGRVDALDILLREPAPPAEFPPLDLATPVELEPGNTFRRYSAEGLADTEVRAQVAADPWSLPAEWMGFILTAFLAAAGVVVFRLRRRSVGPGDDAGRKGAGRSSREDLLVAIATLDEDFSALEAPTADQRAAYEAERKRFLARLKRLT